MPWYSEASRWPWQNAPSPVGHVKTVASKHFCLTHYVRHASLSPGLEGNPFHFPDSDASHHPVSHLHTPIPELWILTAVIGKASLSLSQSADEETERWRNQQESRIWTQTVCLLCLCSVLWITPVGTSREWKLIPFFLSLKDLGSLIRDRTLTLGSERSEP